MTNESKNQTSNVGPSSIELHQKSKLLSIIFSDGFEFNFPCEYLRVFSTSADIKVAAKPVAEKAQVSISNIEYQGNYALRIYFNDGHKTGIYSWQRLHDLGKNYEIYWKEYCQNLQDHNYSRHLSTDRNKNPTSKTIHLLYFMHLAELTETTAETVTLPAEVNTVDSLLTHLGKRHVSWQPVFNFKNVQVTINKQFAELFTPIEENDEIAIVPRADTGK